VSDDPADLLAVGIHGLAWLESAPRFEAVALDERGWPVRILAADPRAFAVHKYWLAREAEGRDPLKRRRDELQARAVALVCRRYFPHLPFRTDALRMPPLALVEAAAPLFEADETGTAGASGAPPRRCLPRRRRRR
jgi:hypothetical protein